MIDVEAVYRDFIKGMTVRVHDEKQTRMFFFGALALGMKLAADSVMDDQSAAIATDGYCVNFEVADALEQIRNTQKSGWTAP